MRHINITQSGLVKNMFGKISGFVVNSHTSGTLALVDGTESGVAASSVLTSSGACVPASHGQTKLTSNATNVSDGDTVVIGAITYRFKNTMAQAYDVKIGADAATTLDNLKAAINASGTAGTEYYAGTMAHTYFIATTNTDTTQIITARTVAGTTATNTLNALATTSTAATLSWADTTYGGGTGDSNPAVTTAAATFTINGREYTAVLELSETSGATAVADQVLWVTSEAVFLDNVKLAINASGIAGTNYSTGTTANYDVVATTNSNTEQTIVSRQLGTVGNSITTTETLGNYAWTGTTLASGTGATGKLLMNTFTLPTGSSVQNFGEVSFDTGLYATVGGTAADITLLVD